MVAVRVLCLDHALRSIMTVLAGLKAIHLSADRPPGFKGLALDEADTIAEAERRLRRLLPEAASAVRGSDALLHEAFEPAHEIVAHLDELEHSLEPLTERERGLLDDAASLEETVAFLDPLEAAGLDPAELKEPYFVALFIGLLPVDGVPSLRAALQSVSHAIEVAPAQDGHVRLWLGVAREHRARVEGVLECHYFTPAAIPASGSLSELLDGVEEERWKLREEIASVKAEAKVLLEQSMPLLRELDTVLTARRRVATALSCLAHSERTYLVSGWVPADRAPEVRDAIERFPARQAVMLEGSGDGEPPADFRRPRWLQSFGSLVELFGYPSYRDIDPAPFAALSFLTLFGIMFADVGHGAVLVLAGVLLGALGRAQWRRHGWLVGMAGASAALFGVLFGSLFGLEGVIPALWFHPFSDVERLMQFALVVGMGILSLGFALRIVQALHQRNVRAGLFGADGLAGLLFYWGVVGLAVLALRGSPPPLPWGLMVGGILTLLVVAAVVPTLGPGGESPLEASAGAMELVISLLANTLSFLRVAAFHLSHAGLCLAVFSLARELGSVVPSETFSVGIIVEGQVLVLALEGLLISIQCLRLNYYEFFSRFFRGDGVPYRPFGLELAEEGQR